MSIDDTTAPLRCATIGSHPNQDRTALTNRERQALQSHCPLVMRCIRHTHHTLDLLRPMSASDVVVECDSGPAPWRPLLSTYGVPAVVRYSNDISPLDGDFILGLDPPEVDGIIVRPDTRHRVGQQVRITGGAFDSLVTTVIELTDERARQRVRGPASGVAAL